MQIKVVAFSGLLIAAGFVAWEHINVQRVRAEKTRLLSTQAEAAQLQSDLAVFETWQDFGAEITNLRTENHELPKLRNEVRQLRDQQQELERLKAENSRLRALAQQANMEPPILPPFLAGQPILSKDSLTNAGFATPEATAQTYFWAIREVNLEAWMNCLAPQLARMISSQQGTNTYFSRVLKQNAKVGGYIIIKPGTPANSQAANSSDHVQVTVYGLPDLSGPDVTSVNGPPVQGRIGFGLRMVKISGEWKVEQ